MRKLIVFVAALAVAGCSNSTRVGAAPSPLTVPAANAALSWRFIGLDALKGKTNLVVFREAAAGADFEGFKSNLTARLSEHFAKAAVKDGNSAELEKLLTPLVADMIRYPSLFEKENGPSNLCSLAVQLPNERHEAWKQSWDAILKATKISGAKLERDGMWTLVSNGGSRGILDRAKNGGPEVFTFEGGADLLKEIWPQLSPKHASVRVTSQGNNLRTEGKISLEKDAGIKLEKWGIPMNTVREPLLAFTAIQGAGERLSQLPMFKNQKVPNELFIWSADETPWSVYAAGRVEDPTNFIRSAAQEIAKEGKLFGQLEVNTNTHRLTFRGLPIEMPFLSPARDAGFVIAGAIPVENINSNPLPKELAEQVTTRTNLLYYDWELTGPRLRQVRQVRQTFAIAQNKPLPVYNSPAFKWLTATEKKLGNAITEISVLGPRELAVVRRSDLGLSAFELAQLMAWISGPAAFESAVPPAPSVPKAK